MSQRNEPAPEDAPIFVRVHTRLEEEEPAKAARRPRDKWARFALVIDTETTIDTKQSLNFGSYRFCELQADGNYVCQEEGIFHADKLDKESVARLRQFQKSTSAETMQGCPKRILLYSRSELIKEVFWRCCDGGVVIVGCNIVFDLTRLALQYRTARRRNTGWALVLSEYYNRKKRKWLRDPWKPLIGINPKDSRDAFISISGGDQKRRFKRARFLNLLTLAWALRNRHFGLKTACKHWKVPGKLNHKPTGNVTMEEIKYCRQDVKATVGLLNALKAEYEKYPIGLQPEQVRSPASIAKAFLRSMNLTEPAKKYSVPDTNYGVAMAAYFGGRAECRIRHTTVPVCYCDYTSEYTTINCLLGIWPLLTAKRLKVRDATKDVRKLLRGLTLDKLFDPRLWPDLSFFALIQPNGDVLPVRTQYSDTGETNIGLNPLTSKEPLWYAGPDLAASALLSQRRPKVIKAIKVVAVGTQDGLTPTLLGDRPINPARDNFFRAVVENRQKLDQADPLNYFLKILANAGGYGIYAELNRKQFGKNSPKQLHVYSGQIYRKDLATTIEETGPWYFPPASLITAGGRLLLAMLEKSVSDAGGAYLLADTDSLAIISTESGGLVACDGGEHKLADGRDAVKALTWEKVKEITEKFSTLNPYDPEVVPDILKVENYNFDRQGNQHQLYGFAISAKRYVLFTGDGTIIKPSEHGLGPYFHPNTRRYKPKDCKNQQDSYPQWMVQGWEWILRNHRNENRRSPKWFPILAMRKVAITTPTVLASLRRIDPDSAKPYNFVISPMPLFGGPTLVGPFCDDPSKWVGIEDGPDYVSVEDGTLFRLCKPDEDESLPGLAVNKTSKKGTKYLLSAQLRDLEQVFHDYVQHPELKSLAPDGSPCTATTHGLLRRRPIRGVPPLRLMGKEVDRGMQDDYAVFSDVKPLEYGSSQSGEADVPLSNQSPIVQMLEKKLKTIPIKELARQTGVDRNAIRRVLRGERVHSETRAKLLKAVAKFSKG